MPSKVNVWKAPKLYEPNNLGSHTLKEAPVQPPAKTIFLKSNAQAYGLPIKADLSAGIEMPA